MTLIAHITRTEAEVNYKGLGGNTNYYVEDRH